MKRDSTSLIKDKNRDTSTFLMAKTKRWIKWSHAQQGKPGISPTIGARGN